MKSVIETEQCAVEACFVPCCVPEESTVYCAGVVILPVMAEVAAVAGDPR